jgi:hypothetical protein
VPDQIGDGKYLPHLTVGAGKFEDLKIIEAEPFDGFDVHPVAVAVYHLGNNGTARKLLKEGRLPEPWLLRCAPNACWGHLCLARFGANEGSVACLP